MVRHQGEHWANWVFSEVQLSRYSFYSPMLLSHRQQSAMYREQRSIHVGESEGMNKLMKTRNEWMYKCINLHCFHKYYKIIIPNPQNNYSNLVIVNCTRSATICINNHLIYYNENPDITYCSGMQRFGHPWSEFLLLWIAKWEKLTWFPKRYEVKDDKFLSYLTQDYFFYFHL